MPVPYNGNPVAVQAPGVAPGPATFPQIELPIDTDPPNGATFAQAFKILADYVAYLEDPFAAFTVWAQFTARWKNSLGQEKFLVDHMGYPGGRIVKQTEYWPGQDLQNGAGSSFFDAVATKRWDANVTVTGSGVAKVAVLNPTISGVPASKLSNVLGLFVDSGSGDLSTIHRSADQIFSTANGIALEWDVYLDANAFAQGKAFGGICNAAYPLAGAFTGGALYIDRGVSATNWLAVCGDGTSLGTPIDTGIAFANATWQKMRAEWLGSGVADDGASAMRFYINGVLAATVNSALPTGKYTGAAFGMVRASGSTAFAAYIGPVQTAYNY